MNDDSSLKSVKRNVWYNNAKHKIHNNLGYKNTAPILFIRTVLL
jgi:hypothetical protein